MHLVVLRRNKIALPKQLPPALDPALMEEPAPQSTPSAVPETSKDATGPSKAVPAVPSAASSVVDSAGTSQHWTKFVDSPTGPMASPGPQPVNFDFKRAQVEQDPRILHPVALRLTPESQQHQSSTNDQGTSSGAVSLPANSNTLGGGLANNVSSSGSSMAGKKEPPPPPPPRPYRGHARSSSLDLNQLGNLVIPLHFRCSFSSRLSIHPSLRSWWWNQRSSATRRSASSVSEHGIPQTVPNVRAKGSYSKTFPLFFSSLP